MATTNILDLIKAKIVAAGYEATSANILDTLQCCKRLHEEKTAEHRWYFDTFNVVEWNGRLVGYDYFSTIGDNSIRDMDLEFDPDSVREVERQEITQTVFVNKPQVNTAE